MKIQHQGWDHVVYIDGNVILRQKQPYTDEEIRSVEIEYDCYRVDDKPVPLESKTIFAYRMKSNRRG